MDHILAVMHGSPREREGLLSEEKVDGFLVSEELQGMDDGCAYLELRGDDGHGWWCIPWSE